MFFESCTNLAKSFEECRLTSYPDPGNRRQALDYGLRADTGGGSKFAVK